jgi:hypothetical protein
MADATYTILIKRHDNGTHSMDLVSHDGVTLAAGLRIPASCESPASLITEGIAGAAARRAGYTNERTYTADEVRDWLFRRARRVAAKRYEDKTVRGVVMREDPDQVLMDAAEDFGRNGAER